MGGTATRRMDVSALTAVDVHVHVHVHAFVRAPDSQHQRLEAMSDYFRLSTASPHTVPEIAEYYRSRRMAAVVFTVDTLADGDAPGRPTDEEVAELAAEHADVLIPFASIEPARSPDGVARARRLAQGCGFREFKFHPNLQGFFPNARTAYQLYEVLQEHRMVALFHTRHTGVGTGTRGRQGVRLKYSNPMHVDDIAVDLPDLSIILAHPSFPWQDEAISVALHKPNVHIDLSGWSPKYFPPSLVEYANTLFKDKVLFGSDFPVLTPDRWLADLDRTEIRDSVRPLILKENAVRLLGLAG